MLGATGTWNVSHDTLLHLIPTVIPDSTTQPCLLKVLSYTAKYQEFFREWMNVMKSDLQGGQRVFTVKGRRDLCTTIPTDVGFRQDNFIE